MFGKSLLRVLRRALVSCGGAINRVLSVCGVKVVPYFRDPWIQVQGAPTVDVVIDIGVHQGTPFLYDAFPAAELILIDPIEEAANYACKLSKGRKVTFHQVAVGEVSGHALLKLEGGDRGSSSLLKRAAITETGQIEAHIDVCVVRLDDLIGDCLNDRRVGLKIDTEGYEMHVLKGAVCVLERCSFVICEVSVLPRFEDSYSFNELIDFLSCRGFKVSAILNGRADALGRIKYLDILFVREDKTL